MGHLTSWFLSFLLTPRLWGSTAYVYDCLPIQRRLLKALIAAPAFWASFLGP